MRRRSISVEEAEESWIARVGCIVELKAASASARRRVVFAVLRANSQDVSPADLHRLHIFHGGVRVVVGVREFHGRRGLLDVDDVDARAGAAFVPLADEGEVFVACHVPEYTLVDLARISL